MNWHEIANSWNSFVTEFNLEDESESRHYGYGKRELYKASEKLRDTEIYYSFKLTKSVNGGVANKIGNRMNCSAHLKNPQSLELTAQRQPFFKRLFSKSDKIEVTSNLANLTHEFPRERIKTLLATFPDLLISIEGDKLKAHSKYHFKTLEDLKSVRSILLQLTVLINRITG